MKRTKEGKLTKAGIKFGKGYVVTLAAQIKELECYRRLGKKDWEKWGFLTRELKFWNKELS